MRPHPIILNATLALAVAGALASCGAVARHVSEEAAHELAAEVRDHVVSEADDGQFASYSLLADSLRDVVDREAATEDHGSSFVPRYTGLADADADGLDDDGRIEITVRRASACLVIAGDEVRVVDGRC